MNVSSWLFMMILYTNKINNLVFHKRAFESEKVFYFPKIQWTSILSLSKITQVSPKSKEIQKRYNIVSLKILYLDLTI